MSSCAGRLRLSLLCGRAPRPPVLEAELGAARELGFDGVCWVFDANDSRENPLVTSRGRARLVTAAGRARLPFGSVVADYFAARPLIGEAGRASALVLERVVAWAAELSAATVVVPLPSAVATRPEVASELSRRLLPALGRASDGNVRVALEASVPARELLALLARLDHPALAAAYPTGAAAERGLAVSSDVAQLGPALTVLRLGDAEPGDGPRSLGRGRAGLPEVLGRIGREGRACEVILEPAPSSDARFEALRALNYVRLMCARGVLGDAA